MSVSLPDHLDLIATAPGGIQKLRGLILELAVRGKLVPQDPEDEPASELLKRIAQERARLEADGVCKKSKAVPLVDLNQPPFEVPDGWEWTTLGLIGETNIGLTYSPANLATVGIPVLRYSNVQKGMIDLTDLIRVNMQVKESILVQEGDLLICARNGSKALVGKTALVTGLTEEMAFGAFMAIFRSIANPYLLYFINSPLFRRTIDDVNTTTINQITQGNLKATAVPLPPLAEQHRIVAKVDELMLLCDRLEAEQADSASAHARLVDTLLGTLTQSTNAADLATNWQRLAAHFDTLFTTEASLGALKQSILQLAVIGKLVPQDPNDEPANKLLKRIAQERARLEAAGVCKKSKPLPPVGEDVPFSLPHGWAWARFPEVGQFGRGKSKHRPRNDPALFNPGIYPLVQTGEVARAGTIVRGFHSKYSEVGLSQSKLWPQGTLCITIAANIADSAILGFDACFPDSVVGFIPAALIEESRYFLWFMKTAREELLKFAPSTAQKNINLETLESVLIPLPPKTEMHRIVAKVDELMALCERLKTDLATARQRQEQLAAGLIKTALAA